jgi:hypothetical protein
MAAPDSFVSKETKNEVLLDQAHDPICDKKQREIEL